MYNQKNKIGDMTRNVNQKEGKKFKYDMGHQTTAEWTSTNFCFPQMNTTDFFQSQLKLKKKNQDICAYATRTKKRVEIDNISRFKIKRVWGIVLNEKTAEIFTSNVREIRTGLQHHLQKKHSVDEIKAKIGRHFRNQSHQFSKRNKKGYLPFITAKRTATQNPPSMD